MLGAPQPCERELGDTIRRQLVREAKGMGI
jgi:hypothetical protein